MLNKSPGLVDTGALRGTRFLPHSQAHYLVPLPSRTGLYNAKFFRIFPSPAKFYQVLSGSCPAQGSILYTPHTLQSPLCQMKQLELQCDIIDTTAGKQSSDCVEITILSFYWITDSQPYRQFILSFYKSRRISSKLSFSVICLNAHNSLTQQQYSTLQVLCDIKWNISSELTLVAV